MKKRKRKIQHGIMFEAYAHKEPIHDDDYIFYNNPANIGKDPITGDIFAIIPNTTKDSNKF